MPQHEKKPTGWDYRDFSTRASEFGKNLRTWLVAYGIGAPVLLFTKPEIGASIRGSGHARMVVFLFLAGVSAQVMLAFYNKWVSWLRSEVLYQPELREKWIYRAGDRLHRVAWIDFILDVWTLFAFGIATWISVYALV